MSVFLRDARDRVLAALVSLRTLAAGMRAQSQELRLGQTAGSLAFLSLGAFVPMVSIAFSVLTVLPAFSELTEALREFLAQNLFPMTFSETIVRYVDEFASRTGQLSLFGALLFFGTAFLTLLTVDHTLNRIWRTRRPRMLAQRLMLYWALLTVGPLLIATGLAINLKLSPYVPGVAAIAEQGASVVPWLFTTMLLATLYALVPNERVRVRDALIGAAVASMLLEALKSLLAVYVTQFPGYTIVYGAFAALPLLLLWLFALWTVVLGGALLAANLRYWGRPPRTARASPALEFDRMVRVLEQLLAHQPAGVRANRFHGDFDGDAQLAERAAAALSAEGYLLRTWPVEPGTRASTVWAEYWLGAPGLGERTLRPLFDRVWAHGRTPSRAAVTAAWLERPLDEALRAPNATRGGRDATLSAA